MGNNFKNHWKRNFLNIAGSFHVKWNQPCHPPPQILLKFGMWSCFHERNICSKFQLDTTYGSWDTDTRPQSLFGYFIVSAAKNFSHQPTALKQFYQEYCSYWAEIWYLTILKREEFKYLVKKVKFKLLTPFNQFSK